MRTQQVRFTFAITIALVFLTAVKQENSELEEVTAAGSFLTSRIDANGDGEGSSWCTVQIKGGNQGSSMQQCINEDVFAGTSEECPLGRYVVNEELGGTGRGVRTFPNGVDQIFFVLTQRDACADANGRITGSDAGVVLGGTGRYAGATGTYALDYEGQILYGDPLATPPQFFGSISGSGTWVINFPE